MELWLEFEKVVLDAVEVEVGYNVVIVVVVLCNIDLEHVENLVVVDEEEEEVDDHPYNLQFEQFYS